MTLFIFDMGGVVAADTDVFPAICDHLGMTAQSFEALAGPGLRMLMDGAISTQEFWRHFSGLYGAPVQEDLLLKYFAPRLDPDVVGILQVLKQKSRVVCGTNTLDSHYNHLEPRGFYDLFDAVYASNKMGVSKPRPEFYRRILDAERTAPAAAVFIDDFVENIRGALSLGIPSILFRNAEGLRADLQKMTSERS